MPSSRRLRAGLAAAVVGALAGCLGTEQTVPIPSAGTGGAPAPSKAPTVLKDEIPPQKLQDVVAATLRGLGHMERYEYQEAAEAFRQVVSDAPGWVPGSINLSIALLNQTGVVAEASKKAGGGNGQSNFDEALSLLSKVIERDPSNLHAHYCKGVILAYQGELAEANKAFKVVVEKDPTDAHGWLKFASTMTNPEDPSRAMELRHYKILIEPLTKSIELNPYLVEARFKLAQVHFRSGDRAKGNQLLQTWRKLNPQENISGPGEETALTYGEMGKYGSVINPFGTTAKPTVAASKPPKFELLDPKFLPTEKPIRWSTPKDFDGKYAWLGRIRGRFGAGAAAFDANGDGKSDLYLAAAAVGSDGPRDVLLINKGDGSFEDASAAFGIPTDRPSIGVAAGDFDADRRIDLFVTGAGSNRLLRNVDGKRFEDATSTAKINGSSTVGLTARWLDLDQDGDLDLYVLNLATAKAAGEMFHVEHFTGAENAAYRNDGVPRPAPSQPPDAWVPLANSTLDTPSVGGLSLAFTPWPDAKALGAGDRPHVGLAALDVDADRDLDLIVADNDGGFRAILNDRLGVFRDVPIAGAKADGPVSGLLVTDLDKDGRSDLVVTSASGKATGLRNATSRSDAKTDVAFSSFPVESRGFLSAAAVDLDLDTFADVVGVSSESSGIAWGRGDGSRLARGPGLVEAEGLIGFVPADFVGDALPDLFLIAKDGPPKLAKNPGNGNHWLAVDLGGRWHVRPTQMRTNPHGIGTRMSLEGQGLFNPFEATTTEGGLGQSQGPIVLGMGSHSGAPLLRLKWPDQVMQCELNVSSNQVLALAENSRKTGSCPVLFTWNGERFVCIGDFLGGGGLGYLVAPGIYGEPDRDEAVAISPEQLKAVNGVFRLSVTEPMDEVAYLDKLTLDVIDRPPGVSTTPDERFAPEGPRPTGELLAWSRQIAPVKVTDHRGIDRTEALRAWDRATADGFQKRRAWIGYAEDHAITLDFGDRLASLGATDRLILCLAGWVEYPYSQTNYAAATAGVPLKTPVLERRKPDGSWEVIEPNPGYPAGLPRMMTVDLSGKLTGPSCVLRIRTNMECYWDQAFVAIREDRADLKVCSLPVARAQLGYRGYTREVSPDGKLPLLYDYEYIDPAPLARLEGKLTRYGDVAPLLNADDDQLCLVGPGDEVRLEFDGSALPELPQGWTRSYVLRSYGYCKDADPFTKTSDTVGPLPYKGMPSYPFGPEGERKKDEAYRRYLETYQTR